MDAKKAAMAVAVPAAVAVLPAGVALAEQKTPFDWSFSGWATGLSSRTWDPDRTVTTWITVNSCRLNVPASRNIELQLTREEPPWKADTSMGRHTFPCGSKTQWARSTPDADYHFSLTRINGRTGCCGYRASASGRTAW